MHSSRLLLRSGALFASAVSTLFPHACASCGEEGTLACERCVAERMDPLKGSFVCPGCGALVAALGRCRESGCRTSALDGLVSAGAYSDPFFRELLRAWKYERVPEAGEIVVDAFWKFAFEARSSFLGQDVAVMAVPMHPFRVALRGFDQGAELAEAFAHGAELPIVPCALGSRWRLRTQVGMGDPEARRRNAGGSVRVVGYVPRTVLLVDDVATTRATLSVCADALKGAGAVRVFAATFLHG